MKDVSRRDVVMSRQQRGRDATDVSKSYNDSAIEATTKTTTCCCCLGGSRVVAGSGGNVQKCSRTNKTLYSGKGMKNGMERIHLGGCGYEMEGVAYRVSKACRERRKEGAGGKAGVHIPPGKPLRRRLAHLTRH